ncbi:carboxymuconolactone decarboxylase family protein [bacterium]|nr:carboxymuconolactone decarboxylase family protein [bacterium]
MSDELRPWDGAETTEKAQRALERLKEAMKVDELPSGLAGLAGSESGIQDLCQNLKRHLDGGELANPTKLLVATAVAAVIGSPEATRFLGSAAREAGAEPRQVADAIAIGTTCIVFNGYYRFRGFVQDPDFDALRAPFSANAFIRSSLTQLQVEFICIAVSSANNCSTCVKAHVKKGRELGMTVEQIDEAIKAAATAEALDRISNALAAPAG